MKNFIIFYYQIIPSLLRQRDKDYYFSSNNHYYLLTIYNRNIEESDSLYYLSELVRKQNNKYHKIILNKDHQVISYINKLPYVLLEIFYQETNNKSMNRILNEMITLQNDSHFQKLYRLNWKQLWEVKIDYFEYQISLFDKKYSLLAQSLPYFIGLAENAIAYFDAIKNFPKSYNDSLSVCHKRLVLSDTREVYNPLNLVIDHKSREIGEYLKQVFIEDSYDMAYISQLLLNINLSPYGYALIMTRVLFPSFYFDLYEQIINDSLDELCINKIIIRTDEYERYIYDIYNIIKKRSNLPSLEWLDKTFKT